jgi:hypothetical protein
MFSTSTMAPESLLRRDGQTLANVKGFIPSLNRSEVLEFFEIAGFLEGLGDWRPKFGKFTVKHIN